MGDLSLLGFKELDFMINGCKRVGVMKFWIPDHASLESRQPIEQFLSWLINYSCTRSFPPLVFGVIVIHMRPQGPDRINIQKCSSEFQGVCFHISCTGERRYIYCRAAEDTFFINISTFKASSNFPPLVKRFSNIGGYPQMTWWSLVTYQKH